MFLALADLDHLVKATCSGKYTAQEFALEK